jgi:UDP:flavonoid glycosyltransferase YjiC (YdhE family)
MADRAKRILVCWDFGWGIGHVNHILAPARVLVRRGADVTFAIYTSQFMRHFKDLRERTFVHAPVSAFFLRPRTEPLLGDRTSYAALLNNAGFCEPDYVRFFTRSYDALFALYKPDCVIAEHSPAAMLSAYLADIPAVATGNGATVPDHDGRLFLPKAEHLSDDTAPANAYVLERLNNTLRSCGKPPLDNLPDFMPAGRLFAMCPRDFDFYEDRQAGTVVPPAEMIAEQAPPAAGRDEVFSYFQLTGHTGDMAVAALASLKMPRRAYFSIPAGKDLDLLRKRGVMVSDTPVPAPEIIRRSRVMLNSGNGGTVIQATMAGLYQVIVPTDPERMLHARAAERLGCATVLDPRGLTVPEIVDAVNAAYETHAFDERLPALSARLLAECAKGPGETIADSVLGLC